MSQKPRVIITVRGPPGSGKSAIARLVAAALSSDPAAERAEVLILEQWGMKAPGSMASAPELAGSSRKEVVEANLILWIKNGDVVTLKDRDG